MGRALALATPRARAAPRPWTCVFAWAWASVVTLATACGSVDQPGVDRVERGIVYGSDDRQELQLAPTPELRRFGEESVVALVADTALAGAAHGDPRAVFSAPTWNERRGLCPGARYGAQPSAAVCSGVLLGPDLVLTAGHCARNLACETLSIVFGFHDPETGATPTLADDDVYRCAAILGFEIPSVAGNLDYGWIRLDRPVSGNKHPAAIDVAGQPLESSLSLHAFTFGGGVPLKIQTGVSVHDARPATLDYFVTALDAFEGASGGPLIRDDGTVVGILVHGNSDYVQNQSDCLDLAVLADSDAAERATYAFRAVAGLCLDSSQSSSLCRRGRDDSGNDAASAGCSIGRARDGSPAWVGAVACLALATRRPRRRR